MLARTDHGSGTHAFYHADGMGNVTALLDEDEQVVARYAYDPFGNLQGLSGPLAEANEYRYSSKLWHAASALYAYGYRFYSPSLQRWIDRDPLGELGGLNLYGFVGNSPTVFGDPWGLSWWDGIRDGLVGVVVGAVVGAVVVAAVPATLAAGVAVVATAVGGYMVGNNAYEFISGEEAYTGRALTQDEWETRGGRAVVDAASLGVAKCKWFQRGKEADWKWLKECPRKRWSIDSDKLTTSSTKWDGVGNIPPGQRGLTPLDIRPQNYWGGPNPTWKSGASPALRFVWPFAFLGTGSQFGQVVHDNFYPEVW